MKTPMPNPSRNEPVSSVILRLIFLGGLLVISGYGLLFLFAQCFQWLK